jgi:hypothetical protein
MSWFSNALGSTKRLGNNVLNRSATILNSLGGTSSGERVPTANTVSAVTQPQQISLGDNLNLDSQPLGGLTRLQSPNNPTTPTGFFGPISVGDLFGGFRQGSEAALNYFNNAGNQTVSPNPGMYTVDTPLYERGLSSYIPPQQVEGNQQQSVSPTVGGVSGVGSGGGVSGLGGFDINSIMSQFTGEQKPLTITDPMYEAFAKIGQLQLGMSKQEVDAIFADPARREEAINYIKSQQGKGGIVDEVMGYAQAGQGIDGIINNLMPGLAPNQKNMFEGEYNTQLDKFTSKIPGTFNQAYNPLIGSLGERKGVVEEGFRTSVKQVMDTYDYIEQTLKDRIDSAKVTKETDIAAMDRDTANFLTEINRQRDAQVRDLELQNKQVSESYNYAMVDAKEAQKAMWRQQRNVFGNLGIMGSSEFIQAKNGADVKFNMSLQKLHGQKVNDLKAIANAKKDASDRVINITKQINDQALTAKTKLNNWFREVEQEVKSQQGLSASERMNKLLALENQKMENLNTIDTMIGEVIKERTMGEYAATREAEQLAASRAGQMAQMALNDYNNDITATIIKAAGPLVTEQQIAAATAASQWEMQQFLMNYQLKLASASGGGGGGYTSNPVTDALNMQRLVDLQTNASDNQANKIGQGALAVAQGTNDPEQFQQYLTSALQGAQISPGDMNLLSGLGSGLFAEQQPNWFQSTFLNKKPTWNINQDALNMYQQMFR